MHKVISSEENIFVVCMHCLLVAPNWKLNQCLFGTWFITRIQDVAYHLKLGSPVNNLKAFSNSRNLVFFFFFFTGESYF